MPARAAISAFSPVLAQSLRHELSGNQVIAETSIIAGTMTSINRVGKLTLLVATLLALICDRPFIAQTAAQSVSPKYPNFPSETPDDLKPATASFDHERREVMIPMRDGVKLHTVVLVPRSATKANPAPILLTRTPYSA